MRFFSIGLLLLSTAGSVLEAYQQQLIPVIREIPANPSPIVSRLNTYIQLADFDGVSYVSLVQVAALLNGHLKWHSVAKDVDFLVHGQKVRFAYYSRQAWINGQLIPLEQQTVKNDS